MRDRFDLGVALFLVGLVFASVAAFGVRMMATTRLAARGP
jgi:hypothetical protein